MFDNLLLTHVLGLARLQLLLVNDKAPPLCTCIISVHSLCAKDLVGLP